MAGVLNSIQHRLQRTVRERLDNGNEVDFAELPILVVGASLKEYLRSLPKCLISQDLYDGEDELSEWAWSPQTR